jgi:hypothetical protein
MHETSVDQTPSTTPAVYLVPGCSPSHSAMLCCCCCNTGLSSSWVGFCVNMFVTITVGLLQQWGPALYARMTGSPEADELFAAAAIGSGDEAEDSIAATKAEDMSDLDGTPFKVAMRRAQASTAAFFRSATNYGRSLDIGRVRDTILHPAIVVALFLVLLFTIPFYRTPTSPIKYTPGVGYSPIWRASSLSFDTYVGNIGSWAFTSLFLSGGY